jgi:hypothetical protein
MRYLTSFFIFLFYTEILFSQESIIDTKFKIASFQCYNKIDTLRLPSDYIGPRYFSYEEGAIIGFSFPDSSLISILCGGDALLVLDSLYLVTDSLYFNGRVISKRYFNKVTNRYARQDYPVDFDILYQDVKPQRRDDFDTVFDIISKTNLK